MDLFNNEKGIAIGEPHSFTTSDQVIEEEVRAAITAGELKYLAPLGKTGGILSTTTIRYTNQ